MSNRWDLARTSLARRFFLATVLQASVILLLGFSLGLIFRHPEPTEKLELPTAFQFGTMFLAIGSWFLSDSENNLRKYQIPAGTVIPAGGYIVFYEGQFNGDHPGERFSLSSVRGDDLFLSEAAAGVLLQPVENPDRA